MKSQNFHLFETSIEEALLSGGYVRHVSKDFDKEQAIFPGVALTFNTGHPAQGLGEAGSPASGKDRRAGHCRAVQVDGHPRHSDHPAAWLQMLRK